MSTIVITRTQRRLVLAAAVVVLVAAVAIIGSGGSGGSSTAADATDRAAVPPTEFELFEGSSASFDDFAGKPLVINFWASWCPACVSELPDFQKVHEELGDDVTFLGMANADQRSAAESLAADVGLTYTLADDPDGELFRSLDLIAMPSTVFVTADGQISEVFGGQLTESSLVERIEAVQEAS